MAEKRTGYYVLAALAAVGGYLYHRQPKLSANEAAFAESSGAQVRGVPGFAPQTLEGQVPETMGAWYAQAMHWGTLPTSNGGGGFSEAEISDAVHAASLGNLITPSEQGVLSYLYASPAGPPPSLFQLNPSPADAGVIGATATSPIVGSGAVV